MIKPIILAKGNFKPKDLSVTVGKSNRKVDLEIENQVDDLWQSEEKRAKKKGQLIYNGRPYRLNSLKQKGEKLFINLGIFDFKTVECLPEAEGYYESFQQYWTKGCHTLATVKTSDEKYLMVGLSGKSVNKNKIDFLGGVIEARPPIKSGSGIFNSLYRELNEEAFIEKKDIANCALKMAYVTPSTNVGFYFEVLLKINSGQMRRKFNSRKKEIDIKSLKIMSRREFIKRLENDNLNKQFLATRV